MFPTRTNRTFVPGSLYSGYKSIPTEQAPHGFITPPKNTKFKTEECVNLRTTGRCWYGEVCHFIHPEDRKSYREKSDDRRDEVDNDLDKILEKVANRPWTEKHALSSVNQVDLRRMRENPLKAKDKYKATDSWCYRSENTPSTSATPSPTPMDAGRYHRSAPSRQKGDEEIRVKHEELYRFWH